MLALALSVALVALFAAPLAMPRGAAAAGDFLAGNRVFVNTDALHVRSGPSTDEAVLETIYTGTMATVQDGPQTGSGYTWYKINVDDGTIGWSVADYLALASAGDGWPSGTDVYVDTDALNLRSGPSLSNAVVAVLPQGTTSIVEDGPVNQDGYGWYNVTTADGTTGWAVNGFTASSGGNGSFAAGDQAVVADGPLNVRAAAGTGAAVLDTISTGTSMSIQSSPVTKDRYTWYQVSYGNSGQGWVAGEFLQ